MKHIYSMKNICNKIEVGIIYRAVKDLRKVFWLGGKLRIPLETRAPSNRIDDFISYYKEYRISVDNSTLLATTLPMVNFDKVSEVYEFSEEVSKLITTQILK